MKKIFNVYVMSVLLGIFSFSISVKADLIEDPGDTPLGQTLTINAFDTLVYNTSSLTFGVIDNYGEARVYEHFIPGVFNNYGYLFTQEAFSISGGAGNGENRKIINHSGATMVMAGYIDMYSTDSLFENHGKFSATNSVGNFPIPFQNTLQTLPFTYLFRGTIKNTGTFLIDKSSSQNACIQGSVGVVENYGEFKIAQNTICNFSFYPETATTKTSFIQDSGEFIVDGYFSAHDIRINRGVISGIGTIEGLVDHPLHARVSLSPGSPIGGLTIKPKAGYLMCVGCSTDIELAAATNYDHLHINGDYYLKSWKLNILLRDGYVPQLGDSFDVLSADLIYFYGAAPVYNLPELPSGLSWDVQNDGTNITITVI